MRYTKKQFEAEYPNDDTCLEAIFQNRFGDLEACPKCGVAGATFHRVKKRQCYACAHCAYQLHPLADTIFRKTTTPLKDWFYAIYLFSVAKNGVSAKELERHLGVTYKTAWRMAKQIRLLMAQESEQLSGTVEIDEAWMGGRNAKKRGYEKKTPVFGAVERGGRLSAQKVRTTGSRVLLPVIEEKIAKGTHIHSDEWGAYRTLPKLGYSHTTVHHRSLEYVRGDVHTNTIEGFWGQIKRSISGTYHGVSPKYLQSYVDEFVFRYNLRDVAVCPALLERATKPV
ncbi:MAG TPA: IS1595 family transposase [Chitinophagaceae bacterium]|nr:IS1595 family transposase [Chitinophagaceae bacterium]